MPLPNDQRWPPLAAQPVYSKMAEWAAWYSGEPSRIIDVYAAQSSSAQGQIPWWRFWRRAALGQAGAQRAMLHVPIASDLAAVSASLLFGEAPRFRIKEAHEDEAPEKPPAPRDPMAPPEEPAPTPAATAAQKAEKRLLQILADGSAQSRLIEAAETAAAIGGVYVYPAWDKSMFPHPIIAVAQADMAIPEFRWGFLARVTFHRVVNTVDNEVWRHIEVHEVETDGETRTAVVLNALFKGTASQLGVQQELSASPATVDLAPRVELPFEDLDVQYIPNIRPNRLWRASGHGVADIQGSETLLDAIDETFASWMRDVRLAKARIIVPRDYLRQDVDNNNAPTFDIDQEIYTALDMEPTMNQDARAMLAHQFAIRYLEHRATARELIERVVSNAGYTPATLGEASDSGASSRTGAVLRVSEHKTVLTQRRKAAHWRRGLAALSRHLMLIDAAEFGGPGLPPDVSPTIEMADSLIDQPLELAQTALAMKSAESASIETRVRILHPEWSDAEVASEVARIKDEAPAQPLTATTFGDPEKAQDATSNVPVKDQSRASRTEPPAAPPFAKKA